MLKNGLKSVSASWAHPLIAIVWISQNVLKATALELGKVAEILVIKRRMGS